MKPGRGNNHDSSITSNNDNTPMFAGALFTTRKGEAT